MKNKKQKTVIIYEPCDACSGEFLDCNYYEGEKGYSHTCSECDFEGISLDGFGCFQQRKDYEAIHGKQDSK